MAKEKELYLDDWYTHEGRPLEPNKKYVVVDEPNTEPDSNEISERAFNDLSKQMAIVKKVKEKKAREDEENRRRMYGDDAAVDATTPGAITLDVVQQMIKDALAAQKAEFDAQKTEQNEGENGEQTGTDNNVPDGSGTPADPNAAKTRAVQTQQ